MTSSWAVPCSSRLSRSSFTARIRPWDQSQIEHPIVVFGRELMGLVKRHPGRASPSHVEDRRQAIEVIGRPLARAVPPAELGSQRAVNDTNRAIPGKPDVPFHVAVEREELAIAIEGEVILVAESGDDPPPGLAFVVAAVDLAARGP